MILRWSDQALFDLDWMYEGVFAACRDFDTTDRYYDGMIASVEAKQDFPESGAKLWDAGTVLPSHPIRLIVTEDASG